MTRQRPVPDINSLFDQCVGLHRSGRLAEAEALYVKLLKLAPREPEIIRHFAILRTQQGRQGEAIAMLEQGCARMPRSMALQYSLGNLLLQTGRPADAAARFRKCLALAPDFPDAVANLGAALRAMGRYREATAHLQRAVKLLPRSPGPLINLAAVMIFMNDYPAAEALLKRALALAPGDHEHRLLLAQTLYRNKKYADAIACYRAVLAVQPDDLLALSGLLYSKLHISDWSDLEALRKAFTDDLARTDGTWEGRAPLTYPSLLVCADPADCRRAAQARTAALPENRLPARPRRKGDRVRIAYLSADYREHATSYLISELIESHDRSAFEVIGLSFGPPDAGPMRGRMEAAFDRFEDVIALSPRDIAERMADLSVDIAVDLQGLNQYNRIEIFSYRAPPVQVLYLGWPGTTGATFHDYILADPIVLPKENFEHFSEKVVWLPHCYQPNDRRREIAAQIPSRAACGLPDDAFVFCCFNNTFKILPELFDVWMRLLRSVPGSVLWLIQDDAEGRDNLRREAGSRGVDGARLIFAPRRPNAEHLARIGQGDLFLDTVPYNAHTTASDALWQGVPVVTATGRTFAARVATSLLHSVGLPQLATATLEDYEALALRLAREPALLRQMRRQLLDGRASAPLYDTGRLTREIEAAYREMLRRTASGLAAEFIDLRGLAVPPNPHTPVSI